MEVGNGKGGWQKAREYPFTREQWLNIFGGCRNCEEGTCRRVHEWGWRDVERATGWTLMQQARWLGVPWQELSDSGKSNATSSGKPAFKDKFAALKQSTAPRDQFTTRINGQKHTHYGIHKNLEARGYRLPAEFAGTSEQLAKKIGITHEDLAGVWQKGEQELRQLGLISITHPPKK